jgi:hypothetical protein
MLAQFDLVPHFGPQIFRRTSLFNQKLVTLIMFSKQKMNMFFLLMKNINTFKVLTSTYKVLDFFYMMVYFFVFNLEFKILSLPHRGLY